MFSSIYNTYSLFISLSFLYLLSLFPWLVECFCYLFSYSVGGGNSAPNTLGPGISNNFSTDPMIPSAPPMIQVIAATPNTEKKQARVLYDYDSADSSELSLLADEVSSTHASMTTLS